MDVAWKPLQPLPLLPILHFQSESAVVVCHTYVSMQGEKECQSTPIARWSHTVHCRPVSRPSFNDEPHPHVLCIVFREPLHVPRIGPSPEMDILNPQILAEVSRNADSWHAL